jgi:hypothetical protein
VGVKGYYLAPPRELPRGTSGCGTGPEHWDTRDTIQLSLLHDDLPDPAPADAEPFTTHFGLDGIRWENGERLVEYYFPGPRLSVSAYSSLKPEVHPHDVVRTISWDE